MCSEWIPVSHGFLFTGVTDNGNLRTHLSNLIFRPKYNYRSRNKIYPQNASTFCETSNTATARAFSLKSFPDSFSNSRNLSFFKKGFNEIYDSVPFLLSSHGQFIVMVGYKDNRLRIFI